MTKNKILRDQGIADMFWLRNVVQDQGLYQPSGIITLGDDRGFSLFEAI